jgi:FkbM family methyltransferase
MYFTGDFGRFTWDGVLEFLGRSDEQIKLRGYRIELGDIEANAMREPGVALAAAVLRELPISGPCIALFVERTLGAVLEPRTLRDGLLKRLPDHMVPSLGAIKIVPRLPLNANGKVDRRALPQLVEHAGQEGPVGGDATHVIKSLWCRHLNVPEARLQDDFIALGGHSLMAIQLVSLLNERLGVSIPVATLLRGGTLEELLGAVCRQLERNAALIVSPPTLVEVPLADGPILAPYRAEAEHYDLEVNRRDVYLRAGLSLEPGSVVVDVGANIGLFARAVLRRAPRSRVVAFEPAPLTHAALVRNLAEFEGRAAALQLGLSDQDGEREFTFYPGVTGMSSFMPDPAADKALMGRLLRNSGDSAEPGAQDLYLQSQLSPEILRVPTARLSALRERLSLERIDLLKIDVQRGTELVLDGIDEADWGRIRQVVIEHQRADGAARVEARLAKAGFQITTLQDEIHVGTDVVYTYALRPR